MESLFDNWGIVVFISVTSGIIMGIIRIIYERYFTQEGKDEARRKEELKAVMEIIKQDLPKDIGEIDKQAGRLGYSLIVTNRAEKCYLIENGEDRPKIILESESMTDLLIFLKIEAKKRKPVSYTHLTLPTNREV